MRTAFYVTLVLTLAFKFWLAQALPMTGDEAYFIYWGVYPDYGFYDHPPMVGWILALLLQLSRAEWVLRLPVIVLPALVALAMLQYLRPTDESKAYAAALAFLLLPVNVWNVLITTDTPLVLFSFLSALCFATALRRESQMLYAASGALLGLAFLSKYFAVLLGLAYLAFVLTQPAGRRSWRGRVALRQKLAEPRARFFMLAWMVPLVVFALLTLMKQIGLHWLLSFVPFFFIVAALVLSAAQLRKSVVYLFAFSVIHVAAIVGASLLPIEVWKGSRLYDGIVFHVKTAELLQRLEPYAGKYEFSADGFSPAVTASYASGRYFFVFGTASSHGRHDDILTDFRTLAGKNVLVLRKNPPNPADYAPYFAKVEFRQFELHGVTFYLVLGQTFDYPRYREQVLRPLRDRYYRIPSYLPLGHCYFCERYFPDESCPTR